MTRRDRAALTLALCVLRESVLPVVDDDDRSLSAEYWANEAICEVVGRGRLGDTEPTPDTCHRVTARILRARLALYLRAVLRADAGDRGRWWWATSDSRRIRCRERYEPGAFRDYGLARPLWTDAPPHEAT